MAKTNCDNCIFKGREIRSIIELIVIDHYCLATEEIQYDMFNHEKVSSYVKCKVRNPSGRDCRYFTSGIIPAFDNSIRR